MRAITGPLVFDGDRFFEATSVLIEGELIVGIDVPIPPGAELMQGSRRTLLPGFIDAHVHIGFFDPKRVLSGGVTTARDTGWPAAAIFDLVSRLGEDPSAGPFLLATGPILTAPGGYPTRATWAPAGTGMQISDEIHARDVVAELIARGATFIKIAQEPNQGPVMSPALLTVITTAAHEADTRVTSHCSSLEQLMLAISCGIDELAHGLWSDEEIPEPVIASMVQAGMTVVPTLHIDPSEARLRNLRRFVAAGGRVIYGTDMGNAGPPPGIDVEELRLMIRAGMSLTEAIASATSRAADYLKLVGRGRIVQGAIADLLLVEGDPREDLDVLGGAVTVLREGR